MQPTKYTQSANIDPTKATFGEKSAGVLALQRELNKKGAGLKEDALYGPLTQAAFAKYNTPKATETPIGSAFQMPTLIPDTPAPTGQYDPNTGGYKDTVDESAIRSNVLAGFQDRINAINNIYAGKLAEAKQQGVGRVGSTTAILANRGLTGSTRGGAIAEGTLTQNRQIEDAINAEQAMAINEIYGLVSQTAREEAQRRREAIESGAKSYIDYIKNQGATREANINKAGLAFIMQGIDPNNLTPEELNNIAKQTGGTSADIITAYKTLKRTQDAENLKNFPTKELSQGEALYQYDPTTGKYKQTGYNPKTSVSGGSGVSGGSTGGNTMLYSGLPSPTATAVRGQVTAFKSEPLVTNFNTIQDGYNFVTSLPDTTTNPADDQALIYSLAKVLDPNSVVREGEYATAQKYSQSWLKSFGKSVSQAIAGTGFLSAEARKNIKDTIASRYAASKKSYDNVYNQYAQGINNLTGRTNGELFLKDYSTTSSVPQDNDPDPLGLFN